MSDGDRFLLSAIPEWEPLADFAFDWAQKHRDVGSSCALTAGDRRSARTPSAIGARLSGKGTGSPFHLARLYRTEIEPRLGIVLPGAARDRS